MTIIFSADQKKNLNKKKLLIIDINFKNYFLVYRSISIFNVEILVEYRYRFFRTLVLT